MCIFTEIVPIVSKQLEIFYQMMVYLYKKRPVFQQDFNLLYVCAMQYSGIISVISKYLKYLAVDRTTLMFEAIILNEKCTKTLCDSLNADVIPNSISKWNAELSVFTFSMHRVDAQYLYSIYRI